MGKEVKKLNADELKKIYQEKLAIIEEDRLLIEEILKLLDKEPDAFPFLQKKTLLESELEITEKLRGMVRMLYQSED